MWRWRTGSRPYPSSGRGTRLQGPVGSGPGHRPTGLDGVRRRRPGRAVAALINPVTGASVGAPVTEISSSGPPLAVHPPYGGRHGRCHVDDRSPTSSRRRPSTWGAPDRPSVRVDWLCTVSAVELLTPGPLGPGPPGGRPAPGRTAATRRRSSSCWPPSHRTGWCSAPPASGWTTGSPGPCAPSSAVAGVAPPSPLSTGLPDRPVRSDVGAALRRSGRPDGGGRDPAGPDRAGRHRAQRRPGHRSLTSRPASPPATPGGRCTLYGFGKAWRSAGARPPGPAADVPPEPVRNPSRDGA